MSGFGVPTTTGATGFTGFGTAPTMTSNTQGQPAAPGFNFGTNINANVNANPSSGFNFGAPSSAPPQSQAPVPSATNQPLAGFNFGGNQPTLNQPPAPQNQQPFQQNQQSFQQNQQPFQQNQPPVSQNQPFQQNQPPAPQNQQPFQQSQQSFQQIQQPFQQIQPPAPQNQQPFQQSLPSAPQNQPFQQNQQPVLQNQQFQQNQQSIQQNQPPTLQNQLSAPQNQPQASTVPAFTGFGVPKTTAAATGFGVPATTSSAAGFSFGQAPAITTAASASLNFGTTTTTTTLGSTLGSSLFGAKSTTTTSSFPTLGSGLFGNTNILASQQPTPQGPNLVATSIAPATSVGLGGADLNSTQPKSAEGKQDIKVKDIIIPQPIRETVENLKNFIKQQKSISSDIARSTIRKLQNVSGDIKTLEWSLQDISNCVEKNYGQIKNLRLDTSKAIQSVEMAQRTHETPVGLQFENTMPLQYFQELVHKYEADMIAFRNQVELTEKHMRSLTCPQSFSPEDLKRGLQQIHESFIALAGRLHEIHQKVEAQKEQYLNLRKYYLRDTTNVFSELETDNNDLGVSNISSGPTPFSGSTGIMWQSNRGNNAASPSNNLGTFGNAPSQTTGSGLGLLGNNISTGFGTPNKPLFGPNTFGTTPVFNLQNPPAGAKRNKQ